METMLAKDEILIKQYDYAVTKSKHDTVMHSVIVTDRRIISQEQGGRSFERDEMPIDHADYILTDFDSYKRSVALSVFLFVLSVLLAGLYFGAVLVSDTLRESPKLFPQYIVWIPPALYQIFGAFYIFKIAKR